MKKTVSNIVLIVACVAVIGFSLTAAAYQIFTGAELSPTLTTCWFSFWGVEIVALATIKNTKTRWMDPGGEDDYEEPAAPNILDEAAELENSEAEPELDCVHDGDDYAYTYYNRKRETGDDL